MQLKYILLFLILACVIPAIGQTKKVDRKSKNKKELKDTPVSLANRIFVDNIRTVKFHPERLPMAEPVVNLGSSTKLILRFDDVDLDVKNYQYSIQHCNSDWTINEDLNIFDYLDGFDEEVMNDYSFSRTQYSDYVHYSLMLPNDRIKWKLSGNYVLKIFDDTDEKKLSLTRRFMVTENEVFIVPDVRVAHRNDQRRSHHEVDFDVEVKNLTLQNSPEQVSATIVQNGHWNNAISGIKPLFIKQNQLGFRYQNKICFEAGKEYRFVDLRSLDYRLNFVEAIEEQDQGFDVLVKKEKARAHKNYFDSPDANGKFIIQNFDDISFRRLGNPVRVDTTITNRGDLTSEQILERESLNELVNEINRDDQLRSEKEQHLVGEYVLTYFTLAMDQPVYGGEVYIFGELSDWRIEDAFKMKYNSEALQYEAEVLLKQGYYNYMYAFQSAEYEGSQKFTFEQVEGNWFEADNDYHVLIYFRPFGQRYDRLIGYRSFGKFD